MKRVTLLFLLKPDEGRILLAMKKRGFGVGKYNGVGGKIEQGETIEAAVIREAKEEIGVEISESDVQKVAEITFFFEDKPDWSIHCHTYITHSWAGTPLETEEMAPEWFALDAIPFDRMWIDDKHWLPLVLDGKRLEATFHFNNDGSEILAQKIEPKSDFHGNLISAQ